MWNCQLYCTRFSSCLDWPCVTGPELCQALHGQFTAEVTYLLESRTVEGHQWMVSHAGPSGFEAWRRMLDLALIKCFDQLSHDRRKDMLFNLLCFFPLSYIHVFSSLK